MGAARDREPDGPRGLTLDSGALIALERGDGRMRALLRLVHAQGVSVWIPAGVLAQVWRATARQASLAALLNSESVTVPPLDEATARAAGVLCGRSSTSDVIDATVVLTARLYQSVVLTSDPKDLRALDPHVRLEVL